VYFGDKEFFVKKLLQGWSSINDKLILLIYLSFFRSSSQIPLMQGIVIV